MNTLTRITLGRLSRPSTGGTGEPVFVPVSCVKVASLSPNLSAALKNTVRTVSIVQNSVSAKLNKTRLKAELSPEELSVMFGNDRIEVKAGTR